MADFERDVELLEEYKQWQAINRTRADTSPTVFLVERAQAAAFNKLEQLEKWVQAHYPDNMSSEAHDTFQMIMNGTE